MRFLLTSIGTSGDINPVCAVGRALVARGHDVEMATIAHFEPLVSRLGMRFREIPSEWNEQRLIDSPELVTGRLASFGVLRRVVIPAIGHTVRTLDAAIADKRPDAILGHHISIGGPWLAKRHEIPWATCVMAPTSWPSVDAPNLYPGMPDNGRVPRWGVRLGVGVGSLITRQLTERPIRRAARALGLDLTPHARGVLLGEMLQTDATLALWSPTFRAPAGDDPPRSTICGFCWLDAHDDAPRTADTEAALRFIERDPSDPPALITFGTSVATARPDHMDRCAEACRRVGLRAIILGSREPGGAGVGAERDGVLRLRGASHAVLMARCRVLVHHAGAGTTAQALRSGTPSVIVPFAHDQPDNGARCRRLGCATLIEPKRALRGGLDAALRATLADEAIAQAGARVRERILAERDGAEVAADRLESLAHAAR